MGCFLDSRISSFHAAKSLEQAALLHRDQKNFDRSADLFDRAGELFLESSTPDTAALCLEKAGKWAPNLRYQIFSVNKKC